MKPMPAHWRLQDAKTQFSQLMEAALAGLPQHITRRRKPAVVVLSEQAFDAYKRNARACAPGFVARLLAMPRSDEVLTQRQAAVRKPAINRARGK